MNVSAHQEDRPAHAGGRHVVGVDFGTLSARALVVRVEDGAESGSAVHPYPHGVIDRVLPGPDQDQGPEWDQGINRVGIGDRHVFGTGR